MISLAEILIMLVVHWLGDFLLQTTDMATKKSKSNMWLSVHVATYMLPLCVMGIAITIIKWSFWLGIGWVVLNGVLHWMTDYHTSRWTSKLYAEKKFYGFPAFFSVIGLDQLIHGFCLFITYYCFIK